MKVGGARQAVLETWQWNTLVFSTLLKLSLVPAYHSTDFEVHRHWLALTNTLPLSHWYFDETSPWTLDYPPFFGYFSWLISLPARVWDPQIVALREGLDYQGWKCVLYMRLSVIASELVLASALFALSRSSRQSHLGNAPSVVAAALLLHPGLVIVDHIHFQYNGFLFGLLLWSLWAAREGRPLLCAFVFSSLLNFKHIFIYVAPAYFVFLLQSYVVKGTNAVSHSGIGERLFTLATITLVPFAFSVVPLALSGLSSTAPAGPLGILAQMVRRLFPFSRGLNHAYWAANVWALYTFADRVLVKLLALEDDASASASRGVIGDTHFAVLPQIEPGHCFLLTLAVTLLFSARLFVKPTQTAFLQAVTLFGLTSFLFGFHVHEKAILLALVPLTLLAPLNYLYTRMTLLLSAAGVIALFPLLYQVQETPIKIVYSLLWFLVTFRALFAAQFRPTPSNMDLIVHSLENIYLAGLVPLQIFVSFVHPFWTAASAATVISSTVATAATTTSTAAVVFSASGSAPLASIAPNWSTGSSDGGNGSLSDLFSSAVGTALSDHVVSAVASVMDATQDVVVAAQNDDFAPSPTTHEFLPLMLTSVYCALGVIWVWFRLGYRFLTTDEERPSPENIKVTASTPKKAR